ncbi:MAG: hypothetical protein AAF399_07710 [Bacteroidota bacterium]
MKQSILRFCFLILACCLVGLAQAQPYQTAVGLRLGYPTSLSAKTFLSETKAVEAHIGTRGGYRYQWFNFSAALLHQQPMEIDGLEHLTWYAGAGASIYLWSYDQTWFGRETYGTTSLGIQGYLGTEYSLEEYDIPLAISIDWVPTVFLGGYTRGFGGRHYTLGVRYLLR